MSVIHQLYNLSGEISIFDNKTARRMGRMKQLTILPMGQISPILKIISPADK